ncbi:hypothetical protein PInf_015061 [Phytophthora infestans]|nr:hypothetical protein PInf_015061 [Phytophthora infestans]
MTRSDRATTLERLEAVMIANELQGDTDGCDEEAMVYKAVSSNRYLHINAAYPDDPALSSLGSPRTHSTSIGP